MIESIFFKDAMRRKRGIYLGVSATDHPSARPRVISSDDHQTRITLVVLTNGQVGLHRHLYAVAP